MLEILGDAVTASGLLGAEIADFANNICYNSESWSGFERSETAWNLLQKVEAVSLQECIDRIGSPPQDSITIFVTGTGDSKIIENYKSHLLDLYPDLSPKQILTYGDIFPQSWLDDQTHRLPPSASWLPLARSSYALASTVKGPVHLLMPIRQNEARPYPDARGSPWASYLYPTLTRNPSIPNITIHDIRNFTRQRTIWHSHHPPFSRSVYLGTPELLPNTTLQSYLSDLLTQNKPLPSFPHPTVFWSSLCETDTDECFNASEATINSFITIYLNTPAAHYFNLAQYLGSETDSLPSSLLSNYLRIDSSSPCVHEPGLTAVLESEMAQGVVYLVLPVGKAEEWRTPNAGVKESCWWCDCEVSVLTRNLKVSEIVVFEVGEWDSGGEGRTVWRRGDAVVGASPYRVGK